MGRWMLTLATVLAVSAALPRAADARCAPLTVDEELRRSRYVFEGTIESVADPQVTFLVTAVWQGAPGARVRVTSSGRASIARYGHVGDAYLVFASGETADTLSAARCGHTAPLSLEMARVTIASLTARGRTRIAPWHPPRER